MANDAEDSGPVHIGQGEFHTWLQPGVVYRRLYQSHKGEALAAAIVNRLRQGKIWAAAELMTVKLDPTGKSEEREYVTIRRRIWEMAEISSPTHRFWTFGDFAITPTTAQEEAWGDRVNPGVWASFTGVRLDPMGVAELADAMGLSWLTGEPIVPKAPAPEPPIETSETGDAARRTRHGMPGLHDDLMGEWVDLFMRAYPKGTRGQAESSARGMFPGHSVDRAKLRELIAKRGIGKSHNS